MNSQVNMTYVQYLKLNYNKIYGIRGISTPNRCQTQLNRAPHVRCFNKHHTQKYEKFYELFLKNVHPLLT